MPRRFERRKKRYLGDRSHGAGNIKNRRGKGSGGGRGRAGLGKHKWFKKIIEEGKAVSAGFAPPARARYENVSLERLGEEVGRGKWAREGDVYNIVLGREVKVLGGGRIGFKANVVAGAFSARARKKIEEAGGTVKTVF